MKRLYKTTETELLNSLNELKQTYEFLDYKDGCLQDNFLLETSGGVLIMAREKFDSQKINVMDRLKSGFINQKFYQHVVKAKGFRVSDKCINCGKCMTLCPLNNIKLVDKKPVWSNNCTHCMACICSCPTEAIEYKNASVGKRRYLCK